MEEIGLTCGFCGSHLCLLNTALAFLFFFFLARIYKFPSTLSNYRCFWTFCLRRISSFFFLFMTEKGGLTVNPKDTSIPSVPELMISYDYEWHFLSKLVPPAGSQLTFLSIYTTHPPYVGFRRLVGSWSSKDLKQVSPASPFPNLAKSFFSVLSCSFLAFILVVE